MFVWDVATGESSRRFQGHNGKVNAVAFNDDASILASGSFKLSTQLHGSRKNADEASS